ncbi:MAG: hypothetical protein IKO36_01575 [Bacteroidaceae bacterium]|nr:hypothetical protein [Bacteroidaceae bacterium]
MTEKELKTRLNAVFTALLQVDVKGKSVFIIADCLREIEAILNTPIEERTDEDVYSDGNSEE